MNDHWKKMRMTNNNRRMPITTIAVIALSLALLLLSTIFINSAQTYAQTPTTDKLLDKASLSLTRPNHNGYSYDPEQEKTMYGPFILTRK
jgi:hypothetical protein